MLRDRPLIQIQQVLSEPLQPIIWDVEPLIARGDRVIFFGEFGTFKSWTLLDLAQHMAAQSQWVGRFNIPDAREVLYIDEEMNERTLRRRAKRLAAGAQLELNLVNRRLAYASRLGVRFDEQGSNVLIDYLTRQHFKPDVIIIDALRRVLVGDENAASDMAQFWRRLEPLSTLGITILIAHHMNKPPADGRKRSNRYRASGSTDILAGSDASYSIERISENTAQLTGIKSRDDVELKPFWLRLDDNNDRQAPVKILGLEPVERKRIDETRPLEPGEKRDVFGQAPLERLHD